MITYIGREPPGRAAPSPSLFAFVEDFLDEFALVHVVFDALDLLVVLVTLAGENNDVALLTVVDGISYGFLAVCDLDVFAIRFLDAGLDVIYDVERLLKTRIV